jgi:hypothetical protein
MDSLLDKVVALEFKRTSASGQLRATSFQIHSLLHHNLSLVRVLSQERHETSLKLPETPPLLIRETQLSRSLNQDSSKTSLGIQGNGNGKKHTHSATRLSLGTLPKGATRTPKVLGIIDPKTQARNHSSSSTTSALGTPPPPRWSPGSGTTPVLGKLAP